MPAGTVGRRITTWLRGAAGAYAPGLVPWFAPRSKFVILTTGRSGSELLSDLLGSHSEVICEHELLRKVKIRLPRLWIKGHAARAGRKGRAFGFKLLAQQLTDIQKMADPAAFVRRLAEDGYLVIVLTRRNLLRQSVSWATANQGGYHRRADSDEVPKAVTVEPELAIAMIVVNEQIIEKMQGWVADLPHMPLVYEDDLEPPERRQATADRIFASLGLRSEPVRSTLVRTSAPRLADAIENYESVAALVRQTRFAHMLDQ